MVRMRLALASAMVAAVALTGCGMQFPNDPEGTLERVRGDVLRVGATEHRPYVELDDVDEPTGSEPALVEKFAERLDADIAWTTGSEAELLHALEQGELDLVIGGFLHDTPWAERDSTTRPYVEEQTADGRTEKHVMIVPMGENAFLVELETFLHEETGA
ncbi:transporter substrate-binding domain-containing protein [Agrococcus lahaulensis]|uniref:transporter substrate-binding domain-containing protein n=1 Tax=Agrococcus lahaulensis TaxID=341722 RepID=UPI00055519F9|nr:transporter substrate-binding domain-containing protein [Agrococcus lahaulensis]